jgi:hypothetical protein
MYSSMIFGVGFALSVLAAPSHGAMSAGSCHPLSIMMSTALPLRNLGNAVGISAFISLQSSVSDTW